MKIDCNVLQNLKFHLTGNLIGKSDWSQLDLISIHIPKTAGTSLLKTFRSEYSHLEVVRLDLCRKQSVLVNMVDVKKAYLSKFPKVVHGHFKINELHEFISLPKNIKIITWLRDPVERVISNYFYLSKRLHDELDEKRRGLNILSKMERSLLEYAQNDLNRNRMTKFLEGMALEDFAFIGFVENYEEDLSRLGKLMNWKATQHFEVNKTGGAKQQIDQNIRAQIADLNQEDLQFYNRALELQRNK
jgi:hypothetical protein